MGAENRDEVLSIALANVRKYLHERGLMRGLCKAEIHSMHVGTDRAVYLKIPDLEALVNFIDESRPNNR